MEYDINDLLNFENMFKYRDEKEERTYDISEICEILIQQYKEGE